jgi:HD-GYP domain-containing protein (c-di-GMP phosphodiesterase class II)
MHDTPSSLNVDVLPSFIEAEALHCPSTAEHSTRVGHMCAAMSRTLGLDLKDVDTMNWVGILHDLGKLAVPTEILRKSGPLTELEWLEVKKHPDVGADLMLAVSPDLAQLAGALRAHHERWNGTGYPAGLDQLDIPLFGRIVAIADVFDALTHRRGYRAGQLSRREGVEFVTSQTRRSFDPELVKVFVDLDCRSLLESSDRPANGLTANRCKVTSSLVELLHGPV